MQKGSLKKGAFECYLGLVDTVSHTQDVKLDHLLVPHNSLQIFLCIFLCFFSLVALG